MVLAPLRFPSSIIVRKGCFHKTSFYNRLMKLGLAQDIAMLSELQMIFHHDHESLALQRIICYFFDLIKSARSQRKTFIAEIKRIGFLHDSK